MHSTTPRLVRLLTKYEWFTERQAHLAVEAYSTGVPFSLRTLDGRLVQFYTHPQLTNAIKRALGARHD